jgi:hypothetical protein
MVMRQRILATAHGATTATDEVVQRTVELAFSQLRVDRHATADQIEDVVRLVDMGALDEIIERSAPPVGPPAAPRRYADVKPFSHEAWKQRHGIKD